MYLGICSVFTMLIKWNGTWTELVRFIFHIETLFFIGIILVVVYFWVTTRNVKKGFSKVKKITNGLFKVPNKLIAKKKKKKNKHEERCREIFEGIFGCKFKSVRPDWLLNPATGKNLELDGFNPNIKTPIGKGLAFEYDGSQHSKYNKHFHKNGPDEFAYQVKKDTWKDIRCKEEGILLIRIPHFVAYQDLERYIRQKLSNKNVSPNGVGMYG